MKSGREELLGATDFGFIGWLELEHELFGVVASTSEFDNLKLSFWESYLNTLEYLELASRQLDRQYQAAVGS